MNQTTPAHRLAARACALCIAGMLLHAAAPPAWARPPRAARVADRVAERVYARQSIAEARAARAEARALEIARIVPEPPPPRPATVRRLTRAGVPLAGPPPAVVVAPLPLSPTRRPVATSPPVGLARQPGPAVKQVPAAPAAATASRPTPPATEPGVWTLDPDPAGTAVVGPDGTRSVLATGGEASAEPAPSNVEADRTGPAVTQPPVELLPTPPSK
jgi:hypothetical protein